MLVATVTEPTVATIETLVRLTDLLGVLANAVLGGLIARRMRFDPIGFVTLAILSGLGGGIIRDTLLQAGPPVALLDWAYVTCALAGAALAFLVPLPARVWDRTFPWIDALALGCWAAAGAQKSLALGFGIVPAILLGTVTAVVGGALRDLVLNRVPTVLGGNTLYATSAVVGAAIMVAFSRLGQPSVGVLVSILVAAALTLLASRRGWVLPEAYDWNPRSSLAALPRPRWRRRPPLGEELRPEDGSGTN